MYRPTLPSWNIPDTHFWDEHQGHSKTGNIMSTKFPIRPSGIDPETFPVSHQLNPPGIFSVSPNVNSDVSKAVALVCCRGKRLKEQRVALFYGIARRVRVIYCRLFGTACPSNLMFRILPVLSSFRKNLDPCIWDRPDIPNIRKKLTLLAA